MECGADELACHLIDWVSANDFIVRQFLELYDKVWNQAGSTIVKFLREHGEKSIAAVSVVFAIWRWWRYHEGILHKRLLEYIHDSDARLGPTSSQVREVILRPGRTAALPQPAFATELREILNTNGWRSYFRFSSLEEQVEKKLEYIQKGISRREDVVRTASRSLQEQRAQLHFLAGAVASARARREYDCTLAPRIEHKALHEFREALHSPGHHRDIHAKECEAFQLLRIGERNRASEAYIELQDYAQDVVDQKTQDLVIARSKRFRGQIFQSQVEPGGSMAAWIAIVPDNEDAPSALQLRRPYTHVGWDAIEQAEIHYIAAWIANRLEFPVQEPLHISKAEEAYKKVLTNNLPRRRFFLSAWQRKLLDETEAGLRRAERAKTGDYDLGWLMV